MKDWRVVLYIYIISYFRDDTKMPFEQQFIKAGLKDSL